MSIDSPNAKVRTKFAIALLLSLMVFTNGAAAQVPDLSGTWALNRTASKLVDQFNMASPLIKIVQTANTLSIDRHSNFQGEEFIIKDKFTLDGKLSINPGWADSEKSSTAVWSDDETSLKITTKIPMGDNGDMTIIEVFRLNGKSLVIEMNASSSFGEQTATLVFDKK